MPIRYCTGAAQGWKLRGVHKLMLPFLPCGFDPRTLCTPWCDIFPVATSFSWAGWKTVFHVKVRFPDLSAQLQAIRISILEFQIHRVNMTTQYAQLLSHRLISEKRTLCATDKLRKGAAGMYTCWSLVNNSSTLLVHG